MYPAESASWNTESCRSNSYVAVGGAKKNINHSALFKSPTLQSDTHNENLRLWFWITEHFFGWVHASALKISTTEHYSSDQ